MFDNQWFNLIEGILEQDFSDNGLMFSVKHGNFKLDANSLRKKDEASCELLSVLEQPLNPANVLEMGISSYGCVNLGLQSNFTESLPESQHFIDYFKTAANMIFNFRSDSLKPGGYPCCVDLGNLIVNMKLAESFTLQAKFERSV
jgi:hypothetical protein